MNVAENSRRFEKVAGEFGGCCKFGEGVVGGVEP